MEHGGGGGGGEADTARAVEVVNALRQSLGQSQQAQRQALQRALDFPGEDSHSAEYAARCALLATVGAVHEMVGMAGRQCRSDVRALAVQALATVAVTRQVSVVVGLSDDFRRAVVNALESSSNEELIASVCYLLANLAFEAWETHPPLVCCVPHVVRVVQNTLFTKYTRSRGVVFLANLSYNDKNKPHLTHESVVGALVDTMQSGDVELCCTTSAVALANLVGEYERHVLLSLDNNNANVNRWVVKLYQLATAQRAQAGEGVVNDDWKLAQAVCRLSQADSNKEELLSRNIVQHIAVAVLAGNMDRRVRMLTLTTLLQLSFDKLGRKLLKSNVKLLKTLQSYLRSSVHYIKRCAEAVLWQMLDSPTQAKQMALATPTQPSGSVYVCCGFGNDTQEWGLVSQMQDFLREKGVHVFTDAAFHPHLCASLEPPPNPQPSGVNKGVPKIAALLANVQQAAVVVLCVGWHTKVSGQCRVEAMFAEEKQLTLVPVLVEEGYRADGWLGTLTKSRAVLDMTQSRFVRHTLKAVLTAVLTAQGNSALLSPQQKRRDTQQRRERRGQRTAQQRNDGFLLGDGASVVFNARASINSPPPSPQLARQLSDLQTDSDGSDSSGPTRVDPELEVSRMRRAFKKLNERIGKVSTTLHSDNKELLKELRTIREEIGEVTSFAQTVGDRITRQLEVEGREARKIQKRALLLRRMRQEREEDDQRAEREARAQKSTATMTPDQIGVWLSAVGLSTHANAVARAGLDGRGLVAVHHHPSFLLSLVDARNVLGTQTRFGVLCRFAWEVRRLCMEEGRKEWVLMEKDQLRSISPMSQVVVQRFELELLDRQEGEEWSNDQSE